MENKGLLFIPDISGFTRFVSETEIAHSKLIIQELLELLINANQLNLEVSEVEGDAILFYRFGKSPDLKEVYKQVELMFCEFHKHLGAYDITRFCQCKACLSAVNLTLKIITHYGEFTDYNVRNFNKLIGKDVIVAHQLLKNEIAQHEYWLVTPGLFNGNAPTAFTGWMQWSDSIKHTEGGDIRFHYTPLSQLRNQLPAAKPSGEVVKDKAKTLSITHEFDTHIIQLFHAAGDFKYRSRWMDGVKKVEEVAHFLPRVGMKCRCIMEDGETTLLMNSYSFRPDRIEFSETDEKKGSMYYYTLEKKDVNTTQLTIDFYLQKNIIGQWLFAAGRKKKMEARLQQSMHNLESLVTQMRVSPDY
jgi:hypothetical protein